MNDDYLLNDIKEVLSMFIKHIRPDGELYPFSYNEIQRLKTIALYLEDDEVTE